MFEAYALTGAAWERVCVGSRDLCECVAGLWAVLGHAVSVAAL